MTILLFLTVALLYSSVGHAGASGYLAVMTLFIGLTEDTARPTALALNLLVASIGVIQFASARQIPWRQLLPFCAGSIPLAFVGARIKLTNDWYKIFVGFVLFIAALRLLAGLPNRIAIKPAHDLIAIVIGAAIGVLSGLTGTGGGIFLTPLLLFMGWATPKQAAGISVAFILVNSAVGLYGRLTSNAGINIPTDAYGWFIAAGCGGLLGSWFGARRSGFDMLRRLLAVVLLIAAVKLLAPTMLA